jgi:hypothetical protein
VPLVVAAHLGQRPLAEHAAVGQEEPPPRRRAAEVVGVAAW